MVLEVCKRKQWCQRRHASIEVDGPCQVISSMMFNVVDVESKWCAVTDMSIFNVTVFWSVGNATCNFFQRYQRRSRHLVLTLSMVLRRWLEELEEPPEEEPEEPPEEVHHLPLAVEATLSIITEVNSSIIETLKLQCHWPATGSVLNYVGLTM